MKPDTLEQEIEGALHNYLFCVNCKKDIEVPGYWACDIASRVKDYIRENYNIEVE